MVDERARQSVNFNSTYFQSFVDFAQQRVGANDAKAVISATITQPLGGRKILAIDQSKTDSVHKWTRGFDEWKVNDDTRKLFKQAVALLFGGETKIPESVKKAMLLEDLHRTAQRDHERPERGEQAPGSPNELREGVPVRGHEHQYARRPQGHDQLIATPSVSAGEGNVLDLGRGAGVHHVDDALVFGVILGPDGDERLVAGGL